MGKCYVAEIRNIDDPTKSGRCQIRKYTRHDGEEGNSGGSSTNKINEDDCAWALPLMPITSASTAKLGQIPTGLVVGSRVIVTYLDDDPSEQYPIIIGSFYRAGDAK